MPFRSIFNKSVPAPFLNIKPSNKGDVDVPQLLKFVFAPLSKYILWLLVRFESIIQLLLGNFYIPFTRKSWVVVFPDIFNVLLIVVAWFNAVFPDILNVDTNVPGFLKLTIVGGLDIAL